MQKRFLQTLALIVFFVTLFSAFFVSPAFAANHHNTAATQSQSAPQKHISVNPASDVPVYVWGTNVALRDDLTGACRTYPSTSCTVLERLSQQTVWDQCQKQGQTITADGYTNNWWSDVVTDAGVEGWISNIYLQGGQKISGVAVCAF